MSLYIRILGRYDDPAIDPSDIVGIAFDAFVAYISERARAGSPISTDQQVYDAFSLDAAAQTEFQTLKTNYLNKAIGYDRLQYLSELRNIFHIGQGQIDSNYLTPTQIKTLAEAL